MSVELEAKKITVATAQRDCEELLVEIVSERRVADEQKKQASLACKLNHHLTCLYLTPLQPFNFIG